MSTFNYVNILPDELKILHNKKSLKIQALFKENQLLFDNGICRAVCLARTALQALVLVYFVMFCTLVNCLCGAVGGACSAA